MLALGVRVAVVAGAPYVVHPDELFQFYEQAHRLAFGSGVVPWEFHDGARSWLVPGLLIGVMRLARLFSRDPAAYIDAIRLGCAVLSLTVVYVGFRLAGRRAGPMAAMLAGAIAAIWVDTVYFAPALLSETLSSYCVLWAILLLDRDRPATGRLVAAGALMGVAVALRLQHAPALLVVAVWHCRLDWRRRWLPLCAGGVATVLVILGLIDWLTWGSPFHSVWQYFRRNALEGVAGAFGTDPFLGYLHFVLWNWTPFALPLGALVLVGAWRAPLLAAVAATVVATHSVIGHKEYRFIVLALMIAPILMGIGAASLCDLAKRRLGTAPRVAAGALVVAYAALVSVYAAEKGFLLMKQTAGGLEAFLAAHRAPALCGLGVLDVHWSTTGGYTFLDRDVPLYYSTFLPNEKALAAAGISVPATIVLDGKGLPLYPSDDALLRQAPSFNYLVAPAGRSVAGYEPVACYDNGVLAEHPRICLLRRPGTCQAAPATAP